MALLRSGRRFTQINAEFSLKTGYCSAWAVTQSFTEGFTEEHREKDDIVVFSVNLCAFLVNLCVLKIE